MIRHTLPLLLGACLLLAVPTRGVADEGDGSEFTVTIYDVADLAEAHPWLGEALRTSVAGAQITPHGTRTLVVKAAPETHRAIERVLTWFRQRTAGGAAIKDLEAATRLRARLATHRVNGKVDDVPLLDFLQLLGAQHDLRIKISAVADGFFEGKTVSLHVEEEPMDGIFALLQTLVPLEWYIVDGPAVEIMPRLSMSRAGSTVRHVPDVSVFVDEALVLEGDLDVDGRLRKAVQALREEVRALRTEIAEIKALLEKRRAR